MDKIKRLAETLSQGLGLRYRIYRERPKSVKIYMYGAPSFRLSQQQMTWAKNMASRIVGKNKVDNVWYVPVNLGARSPASLNIKVWK